MQSKTNPPSNPSAPSIFYLSTLVAMGVLANSLFVIPTMGQTPAAEWRRTAQGWEFAHAVQSRDIHQKNALNEHSSNKSQAIVSFLRKWNPVVLPVSVCLFFVTFGWWLIIGVENQGIVRRLTQSKE